MIVVPGAAVGPLLAGYLSGLGWDYVFYAMMLSSALGTLVSHLHVKWSWNETELIVFFIETVIMSTHVQRGAQNMQ